MYYTLRGGKSRDLNWNQPDKTFIERRSTYESGVTPLEYNDQYRDYAKQAMLDTSADPPLVESDHVEYNPAVSTAKIGLRYRGDHGATDGQIRGQSEMYIGDSEEVVYGDEGKPDVSKMRGHFDTRVSKFTQYLADSADQSEAVPVWSDTEITRAQRSIKELLRPYRQIFSTSLENKDRGRTDVVDTRASMISKVVDTQDHNDSVNIPDRKTSFVLGETNTWKYSDHETGQFAPGYINNRVSRQPILVGKSAKAPTPFAQFTTELGVSGHRKAPKMMAGVGRWSNDNEDLSSQCGFTLRTFERGRAPKFVIPKTIVGATESTVKFNDSFAGQRLGMKETPRPLGPPVGLRQMTPSAEFTDAFTNVGRGAGPIRPSGASVVSGEVADGTFMDASEPSRYASKSFTAFAPSRRSQFDGENVFHSAEFEATGASVASYGAPRPFEHSRFADTDLSEW